MLGKVPLNDVKNVERIKRVTQDQKSGMFRGGVFTDTVDLHCGRPGDNNKTEFNKPGQVMPAGQNVDPECAPVTPGDTALWFDFTVLHEVGHAVDADQGIMDGERANDAGWDTHGTGHIAKKIAAELYAAFHMNKLNKSHPAFQWLSKLKATSLHG